MIDPNEAPDGFVAVKATNGCAGCGFASQGYCTIMRKCMSIYRKDNESVIFIHREKSNLAEFSNIGDLAEARARNERLSATIANQAERIRYLEGATNHATGTPLSKAKDEAVSWKAACLERDELIAKLKAQLTAALESIARMR